MRNYKENAAICTFWVEKWPEKEKMKKMNVAFSKVKYRVHEENILYEVHNIV